MRVAAPVWRGGRLCRAAEKLATRVSRALEMWVVHVLLRCNQGLHTGLQRLGVERRM